MGPQLLLLVDRLYDTLRTVQQTDEIHRRRPTFEPVVGELLRISHQTRSPGEYARWDAAIVRTDAAQMFALDERDGGAKLAGAQGRDNPGRSTADHDHLKHFLPRFRRVPSRQAVSTTASRAQVAYSPSPPRPALHPACRGPSPRAV